MLAVSNHDRELDILCQCLDTFKSPGTSKILKMLAPFLFVLGAVPLTLGLPSTEPPASNGKKDDECAVNIFVSET